MRKYTPKKKRARGKATLSRKGQRAAEVEARNKRKPGTNRKVTPKRKAARKPAIPRVSCPHCGARSGQPCKARQTHVARLKKAAEAKKRKKTPAQKRAAKNKKIVKRVERRNKLRDKSRAKTLPPKRKKELNKRPKEEKRRIEEQRLFDEKLRQIQDEQQRASANKATILTTLQKRFQALLGEAKRTEQLPRIPRQQIIESDRLSGRKRHVNIGMILLPEAIEEIMYKVKQKATTLSQKPGMGWLAVINFASLGESLLGYGTRILSSSLPGASLFQTQGIMSSGIQNSREGMFISLQEKLEELAGEATAMVFINFITISAYTRRT